MYDRTKLKNRTEMIALKHPEAAASLVHLLNCNRTASFPSSQYSDLLRAL